MTGIAPRGRTTSSQRTGRPSGAHPSERHVLADILASVRSRLTAAQTKTPQAVLERLARDQTPRPTAFVAALSQAGRFNVIAECKQCSPASGLLRDRYEPDRIARAYEQAGAAAISIVTQPMYFCGALDHLRAVRRSVSLPLLCKDFIVDSYQLLEARAAGADAVLLIAAALDDGEMGNLLAQARQLDLAALVEVHDESDLRRAVDSGAALIGVNNRNLQTLEVSVATSVKIAASLPKGVVAVAASGIRSAQDLTRLRGCGYHAFLIGEHFMSQPEPGAALADLLRAVQSTARPAGGDSRCG